MKRLLLAVIILGGLSFSASAQAGKNKQTGQAKDTRSARTSPQKTATTDVVVVNGKKVKPSGTTRVLPPDMQAANAAQGKANAPQATPQPAQKKKLPNLQGTL